MPAVIVLACFANLLWEQRQTEAFLARMQPVRIDMRTGEIRAIMGEPNEDETVEMNGGESARHMAARNIEERTNGVPENLRGPRPTRQLTWRLDDSPRSPKLTAYLVERRVISTITYHLPAEGKEIARPIIESFDGQLFLWFQS